MKQERNQGGNIKFSAMRDGVHLRASDMERWLSFQQVFLKRSCVKGPSQLVILITMIKKLFRVFGYNFLVVPSLDFMLEVKSNQKLSVPSVPFIENRDFTW